MQPPLDPLRLGDEVHARAAVQLADDHPFGAIDDELAAAEHDGDVAQVDLFLDRLFLGEAKPNLERPAVGQPQLATLVRLVPRLAQLVAQVFHLERLVVALDGKDLPQHPFQPLVLALGRRDFVLEEVVVALGLNLGQIGDRVRRPPAAKVSDFLGLETSLGRGSHEVRPSSKSSGTRKQPRTNMLHNFHL